MPLTDGLGPSGSRLRLVDAHTHTCGSEYDGPPENVVSCMDVCGIDKAFMFAPLLRPQGWELQVEHLDNIRQNNNYIADFCSHSPERLIAFAVLNPNPGIARGGKRRAARLMVEEAERCYSELGIRGLKMVPDRWTAEDEEALQAAADQSRQGGDEGSDHRARLRAGVFSENVMAHWDKATRGVPQEPGRAAERAETSNTWAG